MSYSGYIPVFTRQKTNLPLTLVLGAAIKQGYGAVELYQVGSAIRLGSSNYLRLSYGLWQSIIHTSKLVFSLPPNPTYNSSSEYLSTFGRSFLNRLRSNSPRWRGTATHKREAKMLAPPAPRKVAHLLCPGFLKKGYAGGADSRAARLFKGMQQHNLSIAKGLAHFYEQEVTKAGGSRAWAEKMVRLLDISKNALAMRREIDKRLRAFAVYSRHTLAQILAAFKELRAAAPSALELFLTLARAAYLEACKLGKDQRPRRLPCPRRPLHTYPCPPSAPLAPPVL